MLLDELFEVRNGIASSKLEIFFSPGDGLIPYVRPSSSQQRTIAGWVRKESVQKANIFPKETIFVSTNGEGSHTYSYVSDFEFVPNSDVAVLIPKREMSLQEKVFFAGCITRNRYRFSYGRKPKGDRLKSIKLPEAAPEWVTNSKLNMSDPERLKLIRALSVDRDTPTPNEIEQEFLEVEKLFEISYGNKLDMNKMTPELNGIRFISRTSKNNGIVGRVAVVAGLQPYLPGALTVALGGSVLSTFLQLEPFYTGQNVAVLRPKSPMCAEELLFYCSAIHANAFRFNACGREANRFLKNLLVPSRSSVPLWVFGSLERVAKQILHEEV